jgi:hypothetical protein
MKLLAELALPGGVFFVTRQKRLRIVSSAAV